MLQGFGNGVPSSVPRRTRPGQQKCVTQKGPSQWGGGECACTFTGKYAPEHQDDHLELPTTYKPLVIASECLMMCTLTVIVPERLMMCTLTVIVLERLTMFTIVVIAPDDVHHRGDSTRAPDDGHHHGDSVEACDDVHHRGDSA
jgi:hypothetical protein